MPSTIGPYQVLCTLGSGGMGEVFLAKTATASLVAVKIIRGVLDRSEDAQRRFAGEVETLRMVFGTRVARFENANLAADPPWLAVEYVPGVTLHQHVKAHGPVPPELGAILGAVLAEGLVSIHAAGLVHRDLKPRNVIMAKDGPRIIDFGLAVLAAREEGITQTGVVVGTPAYMPPEQYEAGREVTAKADIYALGATMVYALTGRTLYPADNPQALMRHITDPNDYPDLSGVPADLAGLVGTMLAHDPVARPSAEEVTHALVRLVGSGAGPARRRLAELTYVEPSLDLPADVDDPVRDPEEMPRYEDEAEPTVLVPRPSLPDPARRREVPDDDISWLVTKVREKYGRGGDL